MKTKTSANFITQIQSAADFITSSKTVAYFKTMVQSFADFATQSNTVAVFTTIVQSTVIVHLNFSVSNLWILLTGFWNDGGVWDDTKTWID